MTEPAKGEAAEATPPEARAATPVSNTNTSKTENRNLAMICILLSVVDS